MQHEQNQQTLPMPVFILSAPQQKDVAYLGGLIASDVVPLLEQGAENRFYLLGAGYKSASDSRPPPDRSDDFVREPLAANYG